MLNALKSLFQTKPKYNSVVDAWAAGDDEAVFAWPQAHATKDNP